MSTFGYTLFTLRRFGGLHLEILRQPRIVFLLKIGKQQHSMNSASRDIVVDVPPDDFFKVISDYNRYRDILPQIKASEIIHQDGTRTVARFTIDVIKRVSYTLAMVEHAPYRLEWALVEGPFTENSGFWQLEALESGKTHAHYSVSVGVGMLVPKRISNRVVGKTMPAILNHFKTWAETHYSQ